MTKLQKFLAALRLMGPAALALAGVPPIIIPVVMGGIETAEMLSEEATDGAPATGAEKHDIAMQATKTGVAAVNAAKPGSLDETEVVDVVSDAINTTVRAVNVVTKAKQTKPKPAA